MAAEELACMCYFIPSRLIYAFICILTNVPNSGFKFSEMEMSEYNVLSIIMRMTQNSSRTRSFDYSREICVLSRFEGDLLGDG